MAEVTPPRRLAPGQLTLLVLLAACLYLVVRIVRPFLDPILIALILAPIAHSLLYRPLRERFRGRATAAAAVTCLVLLALIVGPVGGLAVAMVRQGTTSVKAIQEWVEAGNLEKLSVDPRLDSLKTLAAKLMPLVDPERFDLKSLALSASSKLGAFVAAKAGAIVSGTGSLLTNLFLMIFVLFFFLRDGEELLAGVRALDPLPARAEATLLERFRSVSRSSLLGILGTAVAQGAVGGIGLGIVGLPGIFWGVVMAFASLIPFVGTALVWLPASVFLLATGHAGKALFLALWCLLVVGSIDNFVRPLLMRGESEMSTLWMFFAVVGGLQLFGLPGLLYGPLVFGLCQALLQLYRSEFADRLAAQPES